MHRGAIAPVRRVVVCQAGSQRILDERAGLPQHGVDRRRHRRVVRPPPGRPRQRPFREQPLDRVGVDEPALAEGVAERCALERGQRASRAFVSVHRHAQYPLAGGGPIGSRQPRAAVGR